MTKKLLLCALLITGASNAWAIISGSRVYVGKDYGALQIAKETHKPVLYRGYSKHERLGYVRDYDWDNLIENDKELYDLIKREFVYGFIKFDELEDSFPRNLPWPKYAPFYYVLDENGNLVPGAVFYSMRPYPPEAKENLKKLRQFLKKSLETYRSMQKASAQ